MEHPPTSSALEDRDAAIANLQASLNEMHIRAVEAAADRASIVAFLTTEAKRFDRAADEFDAMGNADSADRCRTKAGHTRTLAAQIARGDDRQGQDPPSDDDSIKATKDRFARRW